MSILKDVLLVFVSYLAGALAVVWALPDGCPSPAALEAIGQRVVPAAIVVVAVVVLAAALAAALTIVRDAWTRWRARR